MNVYINGIDLTTAKRVLLVADNDLLLEDYAEISKELKNRFPDTEFTILSGFTASLVKDKTPSYDFEVDDE